MRGRIVWIYRFGLKSLKCCLIFLQTSVYKTRLQPRFRSRGTRGDKAARDSRKLPKASPLFNAPIGPRGRGFEFETCLNFGRDPYASARANFLPHFSFSFAALSSRATSDAVRSASFRPRRPFLPFFFASMPASLRVPGKLAPNIPGFSSYRTPPGQ